MTSTKQGRFGWFLLFLGFFGILLFLSFWINEDAELASLLLLLAVVFLIGGFRLTRLLAEPLPFPLKLVTPTEEVSGGKSAAKLANSQEVASTESTLKPVILEAPEEKPRIVLAETAETCVICRQEVDQSSLFKCPGCQAAFHDYHLAEWVKVHGTCPNCQVTLQLR